MDGAGGGPADPAFAGSVWRRPRSRKGKAAGPSPQPVAEAKLLLDRDYFTALLDGIDRARSEIFLSAYLFRTIENAKGYPEAVLKRLLAAAKRGRSG